MAVAVVVCMQGDFALLKKDYIMINPNKEYKCTQIGTITAIESTDAYLPQVTVTYSKNLTYKGFISNIPNFKRFKIGDKVKCKATYSIMSECFMITSMRKHNPKKFEIRDWANNLCFKGKIFKSFDDAEEFLCIQLDEQYDTDRSEYYISERDK